MKRFLLSFILFAICSTGNANPPMSQVARNLRTEMNAIQSLANQPMDRERLNLIRERLRTLERSLLHEISVKEKEPASDEQFDTEVQLRELSYLWEPLFTVNKNPRACPESRNAVQLDASAGMPENETRREYRSPLALIRLLCRK